MEACGQNHYSMAILLLDCLGRTQIVISFVDQNDALWIEILTLWEVPPVPIWVKMLHELSPSLRVIHLMVNF